MRLFVAVRFPETVRRAAEQRVVELRGALRQPSAGITWVPSEQFHVTLKFLGDCETARLPALKEAVSRAAAAAAPFFISLGGTGVFPPRGAARVIWLGFSDGACGLVSLTAQIESACADAGFAHETRAFHPHVTLARLKKPLSARDRENVLSSAANAEKPSCQVTCVDLMRSHLSASGPRYEELFCAPLTGA